MIYSNFLPTKGVFQLWTSWDPEVHRPILKGYRTSAARYLKPLRLSRQFYHEIGLLFYGTNEFRFSGIYGVVALSNFISTIGPAAGFLRKVSTHSGIGFQSLTAPDCLKLLDLCPAVAKRRLEEKSCDRR